MIEVYNHLYCGNDSDAIRVINMEPEMGWAVCQCAKEPWHRYAVGYTKKSPSRIIPEYLFAIRNNRLILNMVDSNDPKYYSTELINKALEFMYANRAKRILCHCNEGLSRGPSITMLYMAAVLKALPKDFGDAEVEFLKVYRNYIPKKGIRIHLMENWNGYMQEWEGIKI